ncbi:MAG: hypothetical protein ACP6IY_10675 [Promethearchaeia archaeon]
MMKEGQKRIILNYESKIVKARLKTDKVSSMKKIFNAILQAEDLIEKEIKNKKNEVE